jgi:predicted phosphodiesterase
MNGDILLVGDVHGVFPQLQRAIFHAYTHDIKNIIQLGDFGAFRGPAWERYLDEIQEECDTFGTTLNFLRGNHDDPFLLHSYPDDPDFPGAKILRPNIRFLTDNTQFDHHGLTVTIQGGAYSVDRQWRAVNFDYWEEEVISDEQVQTSLTLPQTDILLCHDSPTGAPNPVTDDPMGQVRGMHMFGEKAINSAVQHRLKLQTITEHLQPAIIAHGHYHKYGMGVYNLSTGKETTVLSLHEGSAQLKHFVAILGAN